MSDIRYEKILQRQGLRSELPTLDSGEFGFAKDTSPLFIGTDPDESVYSNSNVVAIDAFPNAINLIQTLLNNNSLYSSYEISEGLTIETESNSKAADIVNYINSEHDSVVARLEQNVEIVTSENINDYIHPSDFNVNYNPSLGALRPSRNLLTKVLTNGDAGVFLSFDIKQVYHLTVKYSLVQKNGYHRRSGTMTLIADNSGDGYNGELYIGFDDDQLLMNAAICHDFIQFDAHVSQDGSRIQVLFEQPETHETKIYYRIERWNIAGVVTDGFACMPTPPPYAVLGLDDDGVLGVQNSLNDTGVLGVSSGNESDYCGCDTDDSNGGNGETCTVIENTSGAVVWTGSGEPPPMSSLFGIYNSEGEWVDNDPSAPTPTSVDSTLIIDLEALGNQAEFYNRAYSFYVYGVCMFYEDGSAIPFPATLSTSINGVDWTEQETVFIQELEAVATNEAFNGIMINTGTRYIRIESPVTGITFALTFMSRVFF